MSGVSDAHTQHRRLDGRKAIITPRGEEQE
jgi:hypothetical protein